MTFSRLHEEAFARGILAFNYIVPFDGNQAMYRYNIDLAHMVQHNVTTGTNRAIRRLEAYLANPVVPQVGQNAGGAPAPHDAERRPVEAAAGPIFRPVRALDPERCRGSEGRVQGLVIVQPPHLARTRDSRRDRSRDRHH